ncbi:cell division protein FtsQ/DivIB [Oceanimonas baumannii]|uniref:cell division protein FtsQ/DivIB n=1 Tax=Oceanimonas baumannii TaxID=129578 RepID=UPI001D189E4B|nr:cell division protein FtsQ/DivIB [Oceanimonas baumannii]MCC4264952.1 cell division protein FtsQ/DivIB [Oceanimonas baumannii]
MNEAAVTRTRLGFLSGLLFFLLVLGVLLWGLWQAMVWATASNQVPVNSLIVQGEHRYVSREEIRESVLALPEVGNFFTLEVDRVQQQLQRLPWVYQASVRKQWPDTLRVYIVEQPAAAFWNEGALVNTHGEVFEADRRQLTLVHLSGPKGEAHKVLEEYRRWQPLLAARGYDINRLHLTPRFSWELTLNDGVRLILGRDDLEARLQRFMNVYPGIMGRGQVAYLDLRYDTGLAVGWKQDEETENDQKRGTKSDRRA